MIRHAIPLALAAVALTSGSPAATWHVDDSAPLGGAGTSWASPFRYLRDALAAAGAGDAIHIAGGLYRPDRAEHVAVTPGDRNAAFVVSTAVQLCGGYAGLANPGMPYLRDPVTYVTILSGDLLGDDGPNFTFYDDNSYHVVRCAATSGVARLDGLTVRSGHANPPSFPETNGAGVIASAGQLEVDNCIFYRNRAGNWGGGIAVVGGHVAVVACTLHENLAGEGGGGLYNAADASLKASHFFRNMAYEGTGGLYNTGTIALAHCVFFGNHGSEDEAGGGMATAGTATLLNCAFLGNTHERGGGLGVLGATTVTNCLFAGNTYGEIATRNAPFMVQNSTLYSGPDMPALAQGSATGTLRNTIVWGASAGPQILVGEWAGGGPGTLNVEYCDIQGGPGGVSLGAGATLNWGAGNINALPLLIDPDGGDNVLGTLDDDLHLAAGSPCIETGDPAFVPAPLHRDIDGQLRRFDADGVGGPRVDIGADEFGSYAPGDTNCDAKINFQDINAFVLALNGQAGYAAVFPRCDWLTADANGDNLVNFDDISAFVALLTGVP